MKFIEAKPLALLPPAKHLCQECATDHPTALPHNQTSLFWQMKFNMEHGRAPTWWDAMAHCIPETQEAWIGALAAQGVTMPPRPSPVCAKEGK